jgi:hypothetical protein
LFDGGAFVVLLDRIKKKLRTYLEKMAKENEKAFGNSKLDCCQLNRDNKRVIK